MDTTIIAAGNSPEDSDFLNPMGTDGFEFIEYAAPDPVLLARIFERLGFRAVARHRSKNVTLFRQGEINFILNAEPESFAQAFARVHGPSICAMAFRVRDARKALERALRLGADLHPGQAGPMELNIPAIRGIGGSLIYFVDRYRDLSIYDVDFNWLPDVERHPAGAGLTHIDHLTHNVHRGRMNVWSKFYEKTFGFRELKYFDIEGKLTGLRSRAMVSPCGKIRIPINESADEHSQIEEFLHAYRGEGVQHVALAAGDIYETVERLRRDGIGFLATPDAYYEQIEARLPGHGEDLERLARNRILLDGSTSAAHPKGNPPLLMQIFSENLVGPIFFEIIQRKGDEGFGEGNFKALFDSMERDQMRRGILPDAAPGA